MYELYKQDLIPKEKAFMSANDFDKYINNEIKVLEEYKWINNCGAKALKEYGYIKVGAKVISGTVSKKADRYYVSVIIDVDMPIVSKNTNEGIWIDLGLKDFAICSNGEKYKNINKTQTIRKIEKKLKREQKKLSRKYENLKKKGGTATKSNINKQIVEVQKLHHKLDNIRTDYVNKTISNIIN
ncbi:MAG: transposase, partial [Clostridium sp.]|nr:transposase [Clostridium sp.]